MTAFAFAVLAGCVLVVAPTALMVVLVRRADRRPVLHIRSPRLHEPVDEWPTVIIDEVVIWSGLPPLEEWQRRVVGWVLDDDAGTWPTPDRRCAPPPLPARARRLGPAAFSFDRRSRR